MEINRQKYYNYINAQLTSLSTLINKNGKLNLLETNVHCEFIFRDLFNRLYGWNLRNINDEEQNADAIDLIDDENDLVIQVSATSTKQKIESSLRKKRIQKHSDYTFKFIAISKSAKELLSQSYQNPYNINFNVTADIYDQDRILKDILNLDIDKLEDIYDFIKRELGGNIDPKSLDSNLSIIISLLAKEDWDQSDELSLDPFEIDRKIDFNNLDSTRSLIDQYAPDSNRVRRIYAEFDSQGLNKSSSVLAKVNGYYLRNKGEVSADKLFFRVIDEAVAFLIKSGGTSDIEIDVIELCVNILIVDAFIRCKIFENPNGYQYANT